MLEKRGRYDFLVYPREIDLNKEITLTALGGSVLDAAGLCATELGFGMDKMHQQGEAWVVGRFALELTSIPKEYSRYSIETWLEKITSLVSTRNFYLRNEHGALIGKATSLWSLINLETRRPVDLLNHTEMLPYIDAEPIEMEAPKRIAPITTVSLPIHRVSYSDLDMNKHVNSFKYVQWVIDSLPIDIFKKQRLARIDINFTKEALYHNRIYCASREQSLQGDYELFNESDQCLCRIRLQWAIRS